MGRTVRKSNWLVKLDEAGRIRVKDGDELLNWQPTKGWRVFRKKAPVSVKPAPAAAAAAAATAHLSAS